MKKQNINLLIFIVFLSVFFTIFIFSSIKAEELTVWTEINISQKVGSAKLEIKPKKGEIAKVFVDNKEIKFEGTENRIVIREMKTGYHKITLWVKTIKQEIIFPIFIEQDVKATIRTIFYVTDNRNLLKIKTGADKNEDNVIDANGEWFFFDKKILYWHKANDKYIQWAEDWNKEDILKSKFENINVDEYFAKPYSQIDLQIVIDKQWLKKLENLKKVFIANMEIPLYNVFIYPDGNIFISSPKIEKIKDKIPYIHFMTSESQNKFSLIVVLPKNKITVPDFSSFFQTFPQQGVDEQRDLNIENVKPKEGAFGYPGLPRPDKESGGKLPLDFYYPILIKDFTINSKSFESDADVIGFALPDYSN